MRMPGRVAAAIEVLTEVQDRHRPASEALKDWGKAHRFAGSGDRNAIGTLVYDALRHLNSAAAAGGSETARAIIFGTLKTVWHLNLDEIAILCDAQHGPTPLSEMEKQALSVDVDLSDPVIAGNIPQWLEPSLRQVFGKKLIEEMSALAERAPIDMRVNTLKSSRDQLLAAFEKFGAVAGPLSQQSVRIPAPAQDGKHISVESEPAHGQGWFEVQDTASQVAAALTGVRPGQNVADICAGAGGKTLALAALMQNKGNIVAHDTDRRRLRPIFERITRAGVTCINVVPAEDAARLDTFGGFDCVVIDAPCTGTGTWRRKPDAKWKLKPATLALRVTDQREILDRGAKLVKSGGTLAYFTCSVLPQENTDQIRAFLASHPDFTSVPYKDQWRKTIGSDVPQSADGATDTLLLTPASHSTDGFFVALMKKA